MHLQKLLVWCDNPDKIQLTSATFYCTWPHKWKKLCHWFQKSNWRLVTQQNSDIKLSKNERVNTLSRSTPITNDPAHPKILLHRHHSPHQLLLRSTPEIQEREWRVNIFNNINQLPSRMNERQSLHHSHCKIVCRTFLKHC